MKTLRIIRAARVLVERRAAYAGRKEKTHCICPFFSPLSVKHFSWIVFLQKQRYHYIWSVALNGAETWTLRAVDQKHLESFEM
jgi:hypothetical protein